MKKILVILLFAFASAGHCFEVREFPAPKSFWSSGTTTTAVYTQPNSTGVIIFLPGGDGQFTIPKQVTEVRGYAIVLKTLADLSGFDIVAVNSPYSLMTPGSAYPALRESSDHLDRLEIIIRQYQKTHKVWIMGQSNGTFSAVALVRRLQSKNEAGLISGIILNGTRDVARFTSNPDLPVMFIHHAKDGCSATTYSDAHKNFEQVRLLNSNVTKFSTIDSNVAVSGHPCMSGYHMMQGAQVETATEIHKFIKDLQ
jgi:hypothetical protein